MANSSWLMGHGSWQKKKLMTGDSVRRISTRNPVVHAHGFSGQLSAVSP
ncbi:MAG: hypothetical protein HY885_12210 [Deltaproteobacteria bacterium]|nr:hypothetical protein [Deltaproteobacteria bacterium]